ncbi:MAG: hypothetical protein M3Q10_08940 [Chloroflexota bacterium]|nr:hypothetical protein [Chloroflexota bacterium]
MTERRPNGRPNADPTGAWLPVPEAAARLGVTTDAVRMRAKRGTVPSRKVGRRLEVLVGGPNGDPTPDRTATERLTQRPIQRDDAPDDGDDPIDVPFRVAGEPDAALVPVETMLDGMRSLGDRLAELAERNEALAVEVGGLRERAGHQAGTIDRLEAERDQAARQRDALRGEVERLRSAADAPTTPPEPPGAAARPNPGRGTLAARWRRWRRRMVGGA